MTASYSPPTIVRSDGTHATLERDVIIVRDANSRPLLEAGPDGVRLHAVQGDLILDAPEGRVVINAGADIELEAARRLTVRSAQASLETERVRIVAEQLVSCCTSVAQHAARWELRARRVVEHAADVYRHTDGLVQQRAGRMRTFVEGALTTMAKRASMTCDEEVAIDGSQVLLG